jgi:hypothetical protein
MRDFLRDWRRWSWSERIIAMLFAAGLAAGIPLLPFIAAPSHPADETVAAAHPAATFVGGARSDRSGPS